MRTAHISTLLSKAAIAALALALGGASIAGCGDDPPPAYAWQTMLSGLPGAALSVWGTSSRDVYVVGGDALDGSGPYALHFDGARWTRINTGLRDGTLWWTYGTDANTVFMVGTNGLALRYNPATQRAERMTTPGRATLFGVWGAASNDVWAVGGDTTANTGVLWHYDGAAWREVALPAGTPPAILYKVWGARANDVWVVGANGLTLHYDGAAWSRVEIPTTARGPLFTMHGAGAMRVAVGGNASGIVLEAGSDNRWRQIDVDGAPRFAGVYVPPSGGALAVGSQGSVYLRHQGNWRVVARPPRTELEFHAVWVEPGTGNVWAVGGQTQAMPLSDGIVYRFGTGVTASRDIATAPEITACPNEVGTICTVMGSGVSGFNGDGRGVRQSSLAWPMDMTFDPQDGTPYLLDWNNHRMRRVTRDGTFETVMGTDLPGDGPVDNGDLTEPGAMGTTVALNHPTDLIWTRDRRVLMVAWHNHKIRRFDPATGRVFVTLGRGPGAQGDGMPYTSPDARLKQPSKADHDAAGNLYILDQGNGRIRRIDAATGVLSTIAGDGMRGFGGDGGPAAMARFNWQAGENPEPEGGLAVGPDNKLYVSDSENCRIRRIDLVTNTIETVVGDGMCRFGGDDGPGAMASLNVPQDIEFGPDGLLYIADANNHRIRTWDPRSGIIRTLAGTGARGYSGDRGPAREAQLWRPFGIEFDRVGNLFVCDTYNNRVRRIQLVPGGMQ